MTALDYIATFLTLGGLTTGLILWRTRQQYRKAKRDVRAFRLMVFRHKNKYLYTRLPHYEQMVEMTQLGVPLTLDAYFTPSELHPLERLRV